MPDIQVSIIKDSASPALIRLAAVFSKGSPGLRIDIMQDLADKCVRHTKQHVLANGTNKQNWPSTHFYRAVAQNGIDYQVVSDESFMVSIDHPDKPGSMRQRYHGGDIRAGDKLLTIPARAEFYGHSATEFTNLRFVQFASGAKALVIGAGGVGRVDFATGTERSVRGAGARSQAMVAYWLRDSVHQDEDESVVPTEQEYMEVCRFRLFQILDNALN